MTCHAVPGTARSRNGQHHLPTILDPCQQNGCLDDCWGIEKRVGYGGFSLQECYMNRILNCGVVYSPKREVFYSLLICLEHYGKAMGEYVEACAQAAGLDHKNLETCAKGTQGDLLEEAAAKATARLVPQHSFVPWVVVNGIPLGADCGNVKVQPPRTLLLRASETTRHGPSHTNAQKIWLNKAKLTTCDGANAGLLTFVSLPACFFVRQRHRDPVTCTGGRCSCYEILQCMEAANSDLRGGATLTRQSRLSCISTWLNLLRVSAIVSLALNTSSC